MKDRQTNRNRCLAGILLLAFLLLAAQVAQGAGSTSFLTSPSATFETRVTQSSDDGEEDVDDGSVAVRSRDLELGGDLGGLRTVGIRFQGVAIPRDAQITEAYLELAVAEARVEVTSVTIHGQAADNAATFAASVLNISSRTKTTASVPWTNIPAWTVVAAPHLSPNLAPIIQEIVDRPGWAPGQALALILSGTGRRTAYSYDGAAEQGQTGLAPRLIVTYEGEPPVCHTLATGVEPSGGGTVSRNPSPNCGSQYIEGTRVSLTATPTYGYSFDRWSGQASGTSATTEVTIAGPTAVTAHFRADPDDYEPDDTPDKANWLGDRQPQPHSIVPPDDVDWAWFLVNEKSRVVLETSGPENDATRLCLYDGELAKLECDSDSGPGKFSRIDRECGADALPSGRYYLKVHENGMDRAILSYNVVAAITPCGSTEVQRLVASVSDDGEEQLTSGEVVLYSRDLELGLDGNEPQLVGIRFPNLPLPQGASIKAAYVQFTAAEADSAPTNLTIFGQDANNAPPFTTDRFDISKRPRTTSFKDWKDLSPWAVVHGVHRSPDLSPIIQEIVDRPGWSPGNALALLAGGSGRRTAESYDGALQQSKPGMAPRLIVIYEDPAPACHRLSIAAVPGGGGSVATSPPPNCAGGLYTAGTRVQVTAQAAPGYRFERWSGALSGSANPASVVMDGGKTLIAWFNLQNSQGAIYLPAIRRVVP